MLSYKSRNEVIKMPMFTIIREENKNKYVDKVKENYYNKGG